MSKKKEKKYQNNQPVSQEIGNENSFDVQKEENDLSKTPKQETGITFSSLEKEITEVFDEFANPAKEEVTIDRFIDNEVTIDRFIHQEITIDAFIKQEGENLSSDVEVIKKKKTSKKKKGNALLVISLLLNIALALCLLFNYINKNEQTTSQDEKGEEVVVEKNNGGGSKKQETSVKKTKEEELHDIFLENQAKAYYKDDYVGQIIFESEIINQPVMQGASNDTYLRRDFDTFDWSIAGPPFLEYSCNREKDKNWVIYGHNWYKADDPEQKMQFTPLHVLEKQENYEQNKIIYLVLEDRIDVYQVVSVYDVKIVEEEGVQYLGDNEPIYWKNSYTKKEFTEYMKAVKEREKYDTGVEVAYSDHLLTLQTCYETSINKLIVLAKRIESNTYKK